MSQREPVLNHISSDFLSQGWKTDKQKQQNNVCMIMLNGGKKIIFHKFSERRKQFSIVLTLQLRSIGRVLFHFVCSYYFKATQKKAELSFWFAATPVWVIWPQFFWNLHKCFPHSAKKAFFHFNFSVYQESISGLSTAKWNAFQAGFFRLH